MIDLKGFQVLDYWEANGHSWESKILDIWQSSVLFGVHSGLEDMGCMVNSPPSPSFYGKNLLVLLLCDLLKGMLWVV